ncbi:MAG: DUF4373 domain-containing protein [Prevotellaceae bacterium]|jgi:hypothetical protein|nr:DUF4373 domain-containing protein [Prevotellaceae bacterium]
MKQTNYFSHDSNARNDDKIIAVRMKHGMEGYGVYFAIIERMRDSNDYFHVKDYNIIAFDLRVSNTLIKSIVEDFGLFQCTDDGSRFYSKSLLDRMQMHDNNNIQKDKQTLTPEIIKNDNSLACATSNKQKKESNLKSNIISNETTLPFENESEIKKENEPQNERFAKFQNWIIENAPNVAKMKDPFTEKQFNSLVEEHQMQDITEILLAMHNYKPLLIQNVSANLTFKNWIRRRNK